jgi:hypothetical protein
MTRKLTKLFTATAILAGLGTGIAALADEATPSYQPRQGCGMMRDHGGMMQQMGPDQMKQMTRMVQNCNRLMESMTTTHEPNGETTPRPNG